MQLNKRTREQELRAAVVRPGTLKNPKAMPMDFNLGEGVVLRWVRKFYNGAEEDRVNFFNRRNQGWEPVKAEELPAKYSYLKDSDGNISMYGCVLCKNDAEVVAQHTAYYQSMALGMARGATEEYESGGTDSRMPKFSQSKQRVIRGSVPA